ncbi:MAG: hypothetical protein K2J49_05690 [Muribaculaceae bacterium]|nr:hypothetical protein [Muribaculaceae bacterium]
MENNIELFERYIDLDMSPYEQVEFESRLKLDKDLLNDFRIYLFTLDGIMRDEREDNAEFTYALKNISDEAFQNVLGHRSKRPSRVWNMAVERLFWAASIVVILASGLFTVYNVERDGRFKLDNTIFAYNYIHTPSRDGNVTTDISSMTENELRDYIPQLKEEYRMAPSDDIQLCEDCGMRLAMAYLKLHDRKQAIEVLTELSERFADDDFFASQCQRIIRQLE